MNLKELRLINKKSQSEIAAVVGTTQSNYGKYELGTIEPDISTLVKLADFYGVSLDYLVGREFKNDLGFLTSTQYETLKKFLELSEADQGVALGYITFLGDNKKS